MNQLLCHASAVAVDGLGVLVLGASGAGKSSLCLQLISLGADLVSDDQTKLSLRNGKLWAEAPPTIAGLIEARGVGILRLPNTTAAIELAIDLDLLETERLPQHHSVTILEQNIPCLHKVDGMAWPASILLYLKGSRRDP